MCFSQFAGPKYDIGMSAWSGESYLPGCRLLVSLHGGMGYIALCAVSFSIRALVPFMRVPLS